LQSLEQGAELLLLLLLLQDCGELMINLCSLYSRQCGAAAIATRAGSLQEIGLVDTHFLPQHVAALSSATQLHLSCFAQLPLLLLLLLLLAVVSLPHTRTCCCHYWKEYHACTLARWPSRSAPHNSSSSSSCLAQLRRLQNGWKPP
jgi:hypothetical protein